MQHWGGAYATLKKGINEAVTVVGKAKELAKDLAEEQLLGNAKVLKDYRLHGPVASCGPLDVWKIYCGTAKNPSALVHNVSVWILDKKHLLEANRQSLKSRVFDPLFEQQRRNCSQMARLKHPGVVKVVEPLEENATQMVLVTEEVVGSLHNVLHRFQGLPAAGAVVQAQADGSKGRQDAMLCVLPSAAECKLGMLQLAETLAFLHSAGIVLVGLNPQTIMLTEDGGWKLAAFAHAVSCGQPAGGSGSGTSAAGTLFSYTDPFPPAWEEAAKPTLAYMAPELVAGWVGTAQQLGAVTPAADAFSLAAVAAEALPPAPSADGGNSARGCGGTPLLTVRSNVNDYRVQAGLLATAELPTVPAQLRPVLRCMLSMTPAARPGVVAFAGSAFFQEDKALRALRFLDSMLQRDLVQKQAFVHALASFWQQYDRRLLRTKVLPPLMQELRNPALQLAVLPVVVSILSAQGAAEFRSLWLPQLSPLMETASEEVLHLLIQHSGTVARLMTPAAVTSHIVPLYLRALDSSQARLQGEALRRLSFAVAGRSTDTGRVPASRVADGNSGADGPVLLLDPGVLHSAVLPRALGLSLRTTSAAVRCSALALLAQLAEGLADRSDSEQMVHAAAQIVCVDPSASSAVAVAVLVDALSRRWGAEMSATRLLPMLTPLLVNRALDAQQFADIMATVQGMLQRIQTKMEPDIAQRRAQSTAAAGIDSRQQSAVGWDTPLEAAPSRTDGYVNPFSAPAALPSSSSTTSSVPTPATWPTPGVGASASSVAVRAAQLQATSGVSAAIAGRAGHAPGPTANRVLLKPPPAASGGIDLLGALPTGHVGNHQTSDATASAAAAQFTDPFAASSFSTPAAECMPPRWPAAAPSPALQASQWTMPALPAPSSDGNSDYDPWASAAALCLSPQLANSNGSRHAPAQTGQATRPMFTSQPSTVATTAQGNGIMFGTSTAPADHVSNSSDAGWSPQGCGDSRSNPRFEPGAVAAAHPALPSKLGQPAVALLGSDFAELAFPKVTNQNGAGSTQGTCSTGGGQGAMSGDLFAGLLTSSPYNNSSVAPKASAWQQSSAQPYQLTSMPHASATVMAAPPVNVSRSTLADSLI